MQIDIAGASQKGAPPTESTGFSSESTGVSSESTGVSSETVTIPGSFADWLDAVADDQVESTAADNARARGEEDPIDADWMTVPVVVPYVPVMPQDLVKFEDGARGDETDVEAIAGVDAEVGVDTALPDVIASPDVNPFIDADASKAVETKQWERESSAEVESATPVVPKVDEKPFAKVDEKPSAMAVGAPAETAVPDKAAPEPKTEDIAPFFATRANARAEPMLKSDKAAETKTSPAPKVPEANDAVKAAVPEPTANNAALNAVTEKVGVRAESPPNATPNEPTQGSKGVAARFARALERASEHAATAPAVATGESSQSANQNGDGQPSFGEWLREQIPQLAAARAHNAAAPVVTLVAPTQNDARISSLLASAGVNLPPTASALPHEHDVTLQMVQSMRMQFRDGIGEAVLKLKPEHLGSVSISLKVENGGLKANVQAEVPAVRQWLESQQETLRSALAEHGLRLDRFDVEPDAQRQQAGDDRQRGQSRKRHSQKREAEHPVFEVVV